LAMFLFTLSCIKFSIYNHYSIFISTLNKTEL
jgi:hypothetical protein